MSKKPLDRIRMRAAWRAGGFKTHRQLSKAAGIDHTTVDRYFPKSKGQPRESELIQERTLHKLASALRVPADWLSGESHTLPWVARHPAWEALMPSSEKRPEALFDEDFMVFRVRLSHFLVTVEKTVRRDLREWQGKSGDQSFEEWGKAIVGTFRVMAETLRWRLVLTQSPHDNPYNGLLMGAFKQGTSAIPTVDFLAYGVAPWLEGTALLNVNGIRGLLDTMFAEEDAIRARSQALVDEVRELDPSADVTDFDGTMLGVSRDVFHYVLREYEDARLEGRASHVDSKFD